MSIKRNEWSEQTAVKHVFSVSQTKQHIEDCRLSKLSHGRTWQNMAEHGRSMLRAGLGVQCTTFTGQVCRLTCI